MPQHKHTGRGSSDPVVSNDPTGRVVGNNQGLLYHPYATPAPMAPNAITHVGGGQAHNNMQPYLALNFCIALQGLFPSRN